MTRFPRRGGTETPGPKGDPYAVAPTPQVPLWWVLRGPGGGGVWAGMLRRSAPRQSGAWGLENSAWASSQKPVHAKDSHRDTPACAVRALL